MVARSSAARPPPGAPLKASSRESKPTVNLRYRSSCLRLRSGTKPTICDLPPARIVRDCHATADAADPRPPSPGSPRKSGTRSGARSGTCSKETAPSATSHASQKRIARARVRRSVTRSASQRVGVSLDTGPACEAVVYRSRMICPLPLRPLRWLKAAGVSGSSLLRRWFWWSRSSRFSIRSLVLVAGARSARPAVFVAVVLLLGSSRLIRSFLSGSLSRN